MIEVRNITKSFDGRTVLHGVSATFETGKTNLIIGQSGSGKTVLMKSLVGLLQPEKGEILFDGRNLLSMSRAEIHELRKEIGMLFQGSALFDSETVLGNVMFPLSMFTDMTRRQMRDRAMFCLERVNLKGAENKYPAEISGGMQKRVAIARAIALNPKYLFSEVTFPLSPLVLHPVELRTRPQDIDTYRRTAERHNPRVQYNHSHQHPRHELRARNR